MSSDVKYLQISAASVADPQGGSQSYDPKHNRKVNNEVEKISVRESYM